MVCFLASCAVRLIRRGGGELLLDGCGYARRGRRSRRGRRGRRDGLRRLLQPIRLRVVGRQQELRADGLTRAFEIVLRAVYTTDLEVANRDDALIGGHLREERAEVVVVAVGFHLDGLAGIELLLEVGLRREALQRHAIACALLYAGEHVCQLALFRQQRL